MIVRVTWMPLTYQDIALALFPQCFSFPSAFPVCFLKHLPLSFSSRVLTVLLWFHLFLGLTLLPWTQWLKIPSFFFPSCLIHLSLSFSLTSFPFTYCPFLPPSRCVFVSLSVFLNISWHRLLNRFHFLSQYILRLCVQQLSRLEHAIGRNKIISRHWS